MKLTSSFFARVIIAFFWCLLLGVDARAQDKRQQNLEAQRKQLQQEIKQINRLLFSNKAHTKSALTEVEDLNLRIDVRRRLIQVTNAQINQLTRQININQSTIGLQQKELESLKKDYANMILKSYQSKSNQSRMMFLFSSENFLQAYKRFQYLKQYANYRKKQGELIAQKTQALQNLNVTLIEQKQKKVILIQENKSIRSEFEKEQKEQNALIKSLNKKQKSFVSQIKQKQKEEDRINKEIQRLIREAIVASNKLADKNPNSKVFTLTPEDQLISDNIIANKGKLPWPVEQGIVVQGFGKQQHPVVKTTTIQNNGVTISSPERSEARAVFEGKVMSVFNFKGSNPTVLVQHGNYITAYTNLSEVYVIKGQKIKVKERIGKIFTNPKTGKTELKFSIFRIDKPQNPKSWIYRM